MHRLFSRLNAFLAELQRRRVYRVVAVYCVAIFVVLQLADVAFEPLGVADVWFVLLLAVSVAGLPVAAALGWMYDLTEAGVRRTGPEESPPSRTWLRIWVPTLVAGLLAGATLGMTAWWIRGNGEATAAVVEEVAEERFGGGSEAAPESPPDVPELDARRIAVLYFDDHSPGGDMGYLAAGLSEALADELGAVAGLEVVPHLVVRPFRERAVPLDSVVRRLGVGSVVAGSVAGGEDGVRATIRLLDGRSSRLLHSRVVEGSLEDLFAFQDSVAATVGRALRRHLGQEIRLRDARQGATSPEAWTTYRRALELLAAEERFRQQDAADPRAILLRADSMLSVAVRLDPRWLQPGLARVRVACELATLLGPHPGALDARWARQALQRVDRTLADRFEKPGAQFIVQVFAGNGFLFLSGEPGRDVP